MTEHERTPVVEIPSAEAAELLASQRAGVDVGIALGTPSSAPNTGRGAIAGFSSEGPRIRQLASSPTSLRRASPPRPPSRALRADGSELYASVTGTSAAAAEVAGAAAQLIELRPSLDGASLRSLLVGYAQAGGASTTTAGAGAFRIGAAAVGEIASDQTTLGFGLWGGPRWHATRTVVLRNVSTRRLHVSIGAVAEQASESLHFTRHRRDARHSRGRGAPLLGDRACARRTGRRGSHGRRARHAARLADAADPVGAHLQAVRSVAAAARLALEVVVPGLRHRARDSHRAGRRPRHLRLRCRRGPVPSPGSTCCSTTRAGATSA